MFKVIEKEMIVPNLYLLTVQAPDIAEQIQPGQFIILRSHDDAERIPLSVADWNREEGTLTMIFMVVGDSTLRMAGLNGEDFVPTVVGPLGKPTEIKKIGTVICIGGCYGIGSIYPVIRALHEKGNKVITILESRSNFLLYWEDKLKSYSEKVIIITRDGSSGYKGHIKRLSKILQENTIKPDQIFVNGCTFLLSKTTQELSHYNVPIIVSLNPIMIDGTGMCGVCRVTVDGSTKFACVDGPDFDGRVVDWEELLKRRKQYLNEETVLVHHSGCGR
ncbi:MAG: sulfide/dihydroorotate dehydrogenase-like FAD/NAD-binding protein [Armatimonadetes bacterium]|nr:sulfide/dihydroorotate dehydrogenase-like FAD/NAD-binding protein [Armatimonadota bacterium]